MTRFAELHCEACATAPPGKALAKPLHGLQCKDEWGLTELPLYWEALGSKGQAEYAKLVLAEYEKLPPKPGERDRYGDARAVCRRTEAFARCSGDFELLQRVLRRDLSHVPDHLRVLQSLIEARRDREALAWAEAAVKRFPDDQRLRRALSTCLAKSGMQDEAIDQLWQVFVLRPDATHWKELKRATGDAWQTWRQRALDEAARHERGDVTMRVMLLRDDGDLETALALARAHAVGPDVLLSLASQIRRADPATAGAFYLRVARRLADRLDYPRYPEFVGLLGQAAKLLPDGSWKSLLTEVRHQHGRKTKLMELLAKAGM
jgi:tetratricopeptide (TPR) repeat protein